MAPPPKATLKKPPSHVQKPTTKAKAAKEAASKDDIPAPKKTKVPVKSKATRKRKVFDVSDSGDEGQATGENNDKLEDVGDDADKVE
jgi:hypothetical protein